jgi:hypothetical protein
VYADAGEACIGFTLGSAADGDIVTVRPINDNGTFYAEAAEAFAVDATLYGATDGKVQDTSSGTAYFLALEAAGADGDVVEIMPFPVTATTAATVSITDTGEVITATTVDAAILELFTHNFSAQKCIPIPLAAFTLEDGTPLAKFADGDSATPGFNQVSGKEVVLRWNNHATPTKVAAFGITLPPDLDPAAAIAIHWRAKMSGSTDSPALEHECYLGAGDTDCAGTDDEIDGAATLTEYTASIAHGDVGGSPEELTLIFGPKASEIGTDDLLVYSVWLEYKGRTFTA